MVGRLIQGRRQGKGWSQEVLADLLGTKQRQVTRWESYTTQLPRPATRAAIGKVLGIASTEWHAAAASAESADTASESTDDSPPPDRETERLAELGRAVLRLVRESARPTPAAVVAYHRRRLRREFSPELYATIEIAFAETEAAYERMIGPDPDESPDDPSTPARGREA